MVLDKSGEATRKFAELRREALQAPESGIVEVFNYGRGRPGLIPLWAGEGDMATPPFIYEVATRALAAGETFYTYQRGYPELRQALAVYHERLYGQSFSPERFFVTCGGMHAMQIALRMSVGVGDDVLVPSPCWPNFAAAAGVAGATTTPVALNIVNGRWCLDPQALADAATPRTRAIFINSPANPTGWTATREELADILALARKRGWWIIADEIYNRFVYSGENRAPSFHDVMDEKDRILFVQTFSKNWAMTGWRIGWLEAPAELGQVVENLIQYSTSGVAGFMQRAAIAAIERGESFLEHQIARARTNRDLLAARLGESGQFEFANAPGAFYFFFGVKGENDTRQLALRLVDEANIGLAPGTAFGPGGERYLRLCFARKTEDISAVVDRLCDWLAKHRAR
jgi:aspartate/methionine/tyrosine aminotransferase